MSPALGIAGSPLVSSPVGVEKRWPEPPWGPSTDTSWWLLGPAAALEDASAEGPVAVGCIARSGVDAWGAEVIIFPLDVDGNTRCGGPTIVVEGFGLTLAERDGPTPIDSSLSKDGEGEMNS